MIQKTRITEMNQLNQNLLHSLLAVWLGWRGVALFPVGGGRERLLLQTQPILQSTAPTTHYPHPNRGHAETWKGELDSLPTFSHLFASIFIICLL